MTCGIYLGSPKNTLTDKVYIGQSIDIEDRVKKHNLHLLKGTHSLKMNNAYKEYGEFEWEIIKECTEEELNASEKYYIKLFNANTSGFNTYEDFAEAPIFKGIENGKVKKYRIPIYLNVLTNTLKYPEYTKNDIAKISEATLQEVDALWVAKSFKWLEDIYPEQYLKVQELRGVRQSGGRTAEQQGIIYPTILSPEFIEYNVTNAKAFAREYMLDTADFSNMLNFKVASVKGWIIKDLDVINPEKHIQFNSSNRGHYRKQFDKYQIFKQN